MKPIHFITGACNITPQRTDGRKRVYCAERFWQKFVGLMFKKDFQGEMVFVYPKPTTLFLHTVFMRFNIDVKIYGEGDKLIREIKNMLPYRCAFVKGAKRIVEKKSA